MLGLEKIVAGAKLRGVAGSWLAGTTFNAARDSSCSLLIGLDRSPAMWGAGSPLATYFQPSRPPVAANAVRCGLLYVLTFDTC